VPESLRSGLNSAIQVVEVLDDVVGSGSQGVSGGANYGTIQELANRLAYRLNQELEGFGLHFEDGVPASTSTSTPTRSRAPTSTSRASPPRSRTCTSSSGSTSRS
jgi:hypothetical protein